MWRYSAGEEMPNSGKVPSEIQVRIRKGSRIYEGVY